MLAGGRNTGEVYWREIAEDVVHELGGQLEQRGYFLGVLHGRRSSVLFGVLARCWERRTRAFALEEGYQQVYYAIMPAVKKARDKSPMDGWTGGARWRKESQPCERNSDIITRRRCLSPC